MANHWSASLMIVKKSKSNRSRCASSASLVLPAVLFLPSLFGRSITEADRQRWAFQPLKQIQPPQVKSKPDFQNSIDRFILFELQKNDLQLAPRTSREQLIRRVSLDLIGLPPTIEEIDGFIHDSSPRAYEKLVDRLLASPHYGERWARHWLDLARFAESDGFEHDGILHLLGLDHERCVDSGPEAEHRSASEQLLAGGRRQRQRVRQ